VPDSYIPGRRKLIAKKQEEERQAQMMQQMQAMMMGMPPEMAEAGGGEVPQAGVGGEGGAAPADGGPIMENLQAEPEITGGRGYRAAARAINGGA